MSTRVLPWGGKGGLYVGLIILPPVCADCLKILGAPASWSLRAYLGLYRDNSIFRGSNPGGGEIFRTRPDRLCVPGLFPGGKAAGVWRQPPTPSSTEVKEKVELYFYSPSRPSRPVQE